MESPSAAVLVVPCYNEATRLDAAGWRDFLVRAPNARLLFVDDGSRDDTKGVLRAFVAAAPPGRAEMLALAQNGGKAEAVRAGMRHALAQGAPIVGYADADLATPADELARLLGVAQRPGVYVVMGVRVAMLGNEIRRRAARHYIGRVFATCASLILDAAVYDTQCGAKYFRALPGLTAALAEPFVSRWAFDVELLGRVMLALERAGHDPRRGAIEEVPLRRWEDVAGSKLRPRDMAQAGVDLARIALDLRRRRGA